MIRLRLFCAAGMSTSLLERRIREAAKERGIEIEVTAYPVSEMDHRLDGVDVALLGPQVNYMLAQAQAKCGVRGIPVAIIPMRDYGMVNGPNVLKFALQLLGKEA
ncbi:MAG: PTS sugar transporter subunit IIB [Coriobacteriales bacterium]|nr:PTS sugar transporter subunit IIB [Coriobacteriales bacterium]MDO5708710.1 PTS sugar transporter subunit IIB [Coriobacteriales bacterium]